jgi:hypothetical protein
MKEILIKVRVPDTIPDPEFHIEARCKDTFDEFEDVDYEVIELPTELEILRDFTHLKGSPDCFVDNNGIKGANYILSKLRS